MKIAIVGTANIATSTLTTASLQSYHIKTMNNRDVFSQKARTDLVMTNTADKLLNQGIDGKIKVGFALKKEVDHLKSDLYTKHSLPIPIISLFDAKLASELAEYGLDMANIVTVGKQATYSILINSIIAMIHMLLCKAENEMDKKLFEVRTRKILLYSNVIATSSNLIYVGASAALGNESALKSLDIGGLLVTLYRVSTDIKFIEAAKREFIERKFFELIRGDFD